MRRHKAQDWLFQSGSAHEGRRWRSVNTRVPFSLEGPGQRGSVADPCFLPQTVELAFLNFRGPEKPGLRAGELDASMESKQDYIVFIGFLSHLAP